MRDRSRSLGPVRKVGIVAVTVVAVVAATLALVAASASAADNAIQTENALPGTDTWKLGRPGFQTANDLDKQIKGYASATSVNKGETIDLKVTVSPPQPFTVQVFRMGWYGGQGARLVATVPSVNGVTQPACPVDASTGLIECNWATSYSLPTQSSWTSGVYLVLLTNQQNYQNYIQFVVRDDARNAPVLYQQSVATYQAYNNYPSDGSSNCGTTVPATGKNLYDGQSAPGNTVTGRPRAAKVSFDRPYACSGAEEFLSADWSWEYYFIRWMERNGYDVSYSTNIDTHANGQRLLNSRAFLSVGHDEYWSKAMYDAAVTARDSGVNLGFFGGNDVYWQVRFEPSSSGAPNRVMVSYKNTPNNTYTTVDPEPDPASRTVRFRDPPVNRPEQLLTGMTFWSSTERSTLNTALRPVGTEHWIFGGTGLTPASSIPGIVGYEVDQYSCHYGLPANTSYSILASSPITDGDHISGISNASIYRAPSGAFVFNSGTMSWNWALDDKIDPTDPSRQRSLRDPRVEQMTKNLLDVFTGATTAPAATSNVPPCVYQKQMTFEDGSLTHPTSGTNRTIGSVQLSTSGALQGNSSARIPNAAQSYLDEPITPVDNVDVSFLVRVDTRPNVDVRLIVVSSFIADIGNVVLRANLDGTNTLQLRNGNTKVGVDSAPIAVGTTYRVRLRQQRGIGADAVLEASVATAGSPLPAPFAQLATGSWTTRADRVRIGSTTNNATTPPLLNALIDDVSIVGGAVQMSSSPPAAPTGLVATATTATSVALQWTDNASDEGSYQVQRSVDGGATWATLAAALPLNSVSYTDSTTAAETSYSYRVAASNANGISAFSNVVPITTPGVAPAAPTGLTATQVSPTRIDLAWTDNATTETGFVLQRSADSSFTTATNMSLPADAASFSDQGLAEGPAYYRVKAVRGNASSAYSNVARGSRIDAMTFEQGSLLGASGAGKVVSTGTVVLDSSSAMRGTYSARIPNGTTAAYLEETFTASDELFASFYFRPDARPAADQRLALVLHGSGGSAVNAGSIMFRSNGAVQLRNYNTTIGTGPVLQNGLVYRIGLHQVRLANGTLALEAFLAEGDAPFTTPFASTASSPTTATVGATMFRVGSTLTSGGLTAYLDNVRLDTKFMPSAP